MALDMRRILAIVGTTRRFCTSMYIMAMDTRRIPAIVAYYVRAMWWVSVKQRNGMTHEPVVAVEVEGGGRGFRVGGERGG